jgi:hypothetical protein
VNKDKRHAFVKMFNRTDAVKAKNAMDNGDQAAEDVQRVFRSVWPTI